MRKVLLPVLTAAVFFLSSCQDSLLRRFDSFLSSVEEVCSSSPYTEEYWRRADAKFQKLYGEYQADRGSFASEMKREICSCIARYEYLRLHSFVSYVDDYSMEFSEDDWVLSNDRFVQLAREYRENRHSYNSSEKSRINAEILHYVKIVISSRVYPQFKETIKIILRELGLGI